MRFSILLVAAAFLPADAAAQPKSKLEKVTGDLLQIEAEITRANETCDRAAFERIEAQEFVFTNTVGRVINRQQDLESLKDCRPSSLQATFEDPIVQLHGDVAILNARLTQHPTNKEGQVVTRRYRFTDVFVWRDHRWQLVLGHASRLPDSPK